MACSIPLVGLILGVNFVALKAVIGSIGPVTMAAAGGIAGSLATLAGFRRTPLATARAFAWEIAGVSIGLGVVAQLGVMLALERIDAGSVSLLMSTTPALTALIAWTVLSQRTGRREAAGVAVAFAGVAIIVLGAGRPSADSLLGLAFVLSAAGGWSVGLILMDRLQHAIPPLTLVAWQTVLSVPFLLLAAWLTEGLRVRWTLVVLAVVVYNGAVARSLSFLIQRFIIRHGTTLQASLTAFTVPLFGNLVGWLVLSEAFTLVDAAGSACIALGVATVVVAAQRVARGHGETELRRAG